MSTAINSGTKVKFTCEKMHGEDPWCNPAPGTVGVVTHISQLGGLLFVRWPDDSIPCKGDMSVMRCMVEVVE